MAVEFSKVREFFDVRKEYGWFAPLVLPIAVAWLLVASLMSQTGLVGPVIDRDKALATLATHSQHVKDFPGQPIVLISENDDGNEEQRLVVRTLAAARLIQGPANAFLLRLAVPVVLLGLWSFAIGRRFAVAPALKDSDKVLDVTRDALTLANIFSLVVMAQPLLAYLL